MKQYNPIEQPTTIPFMDSEIDSLLCCLLDQSNRYRDSLMVELSKPLTEQDDDEILFLTTEYSKVNFLRRKIETITDKEI